MNTITITRRINIYINAKDKDQKKAFYETIYNWNDIIHKSANFIVTHKFCLENIKELIYLNEGTKVRIENIAKNETGMLDTGKQNATYQVLSDKFKGQIPTAFLTALNSQVVKTYDKEKNDYYSGKKSLRNYKKTLPMPFQARSIQNLIFDKEKKNYTFELFKIPFVTNFGRDKSKNKIIIDKCLSETGEYKLCDSSLQLKNNKLFWLMTVQFKKDAKKLNPDNILNCRLDWENPVIATFQDIEYNIGSKEDFLYKRLQLQAAMRHLQIACKENKGGHGRKKKLAALERFKEKEKNFVNTKLHTYSCWIIKCAINNNCGTILLNDIDKKIQDAKQEELILRNWSYYELIDKIRYKAHIEGIEVVCEENSVLCEELKKIENSVL